MQAVRNGSQDPNLNVVKRNNLEETCLLIESEFAKMRQLLQLVTTNPNSIVREMVDGRWIEIHITATICSICVIKMHDERMNDACEGTDHLNRKLSEQIKTKIVHTILDISGISINKENTILEKLDSILSIL